MALPVKIIIITLQVLLCIAVTYVAVRMTRKNITAQNYLQHVCTKKTTGICKRFINKKGKWQAVYQYHTKNGYGEYITKPASKKTPKPKMGQKMTLMVNPKNPNDVYCSKDMLMATDVQWKTANAIKFVSVFYLLMLIIGAIVATR